MDTLNSNYSNNFSLKCLRYQEPSEHGNRNHSFAFFAYIWYIRISKKYWMYSPHEFYILSSMEITYLTKLATMKKNVWVVSLVKRWRICKIYIIIIIIKCKPKYNKSMKSYQLVSFYSNHIFFSCLVLGGRLASTHFMFIFWTMWLGVGASLLNLEQTLPERRLQKLHLFTVCFALQIGRVKHVLKPVSYSCIIGKLRCLGPD